MGLSIGLKEIAIFQQRADLINCELFFIFYLMVFRKVFAHVRSCGAALQLYKLGH
jgi:hypothetical protein